MQVDDLSGDRREELFRAIQSCINQGKHLGGFQWIIPNTSREDSFLETYIPPKAPNICLAVTDFGNRYAILVRLLSDRSLKKEEELRITFEFNIDKTPRNRLNFRLAQEPGKTIVSRCRGFFSFDGGRRRPSSRFHRFLENRYPHIKIDRIRTGPHVNDEKEFVRFFRFNIDNLEADWGRFQTALEEFAIVVADYKGDEDLAKQVKSRLKRKTNWLRHGD